MPVMATHARGDSRRMMRVQMGNFPPRTKAKVKCYMFGQIPSERDGYVFKIPITYIPEYGLPSD